MPTGYTAQLEDLNWDLDKWFRQSLIRAFGVCVHLRDTGTVTANQIAKSIEDEAKQDQKAARKNLDEDMKKLEQKLSLSNKEWEKLRLEERKEEEDYYKRRCEELEPKKAKYNMIVTKLKALKPQAKGELLQNCIKFALEQLETVKSEYDPPEQKYWITVADTTSKYKEAYLKSLKRDVDYSKDELEKTTKRSTEHLKMLKEFYAELDQIL